MPKTKKNRYSDGPGVAANDLSPEEQQHNEFMQTMKQIASELGLTLAEWMLERDRRLSEGTRAVRILNYKPVGPFLTGSEDWHQPYKDMCIANVTKIMAKEITRQEAAGMILDAFPRLSASARGMWCELANSPPDQPYRDHREPSANAPSGGMREPSPRAAELAKEIIAEVERKMRIGV